MVHETTYSGPDASGPPTRDPFFESLAGAGEMGPRMLDMDWARTALGPIAQWPDSLKTAAALVLNSPVPIVMLWGPDGIMIYNDAYSVFAGGRHPHLLGSPVLAGWPEVADFNRRVMEVGLSGGTLSFRDEHLVLHRSGVPEDVWLNLDYSPIRDETGKPAGVLAIVVETTQRVVAERQVRELNEKLEAQVHALAELDRAKTSFFTNISHEFRTPLTLILGPTEDALVSAARALSGEDLQTVYRNELRLLKLVNALLDVSRIEAGRMRASYEPVDLGRVTLETAGAFRSAIERAGLEYVITIDPVSEPVYLDRSMWERIVLNLLSNALKFTLHGVIELSLRDRGESVELNVRDTGTGIAEQHLPHVFERFHRIEGAEARTQEGSGIGLALVDELVRLHGGTVRVSSVVGKGSTFSVTLPKGAAHLPQDQITLPRTSRETPVRTAFVEEALRWLPDQPTETVGAGEDVRINDTASDAMRRIVPGRVVLADDNADMRAYLTRLLAKHWTVHAVANGSDALEAARQYEPDVVLTDVMMPGLDGFALLRSLRADAKTAGVRVIVLSARSGEEARVEGLQLGADDYLVKPFSARELIARVNSQVTLSRHNRERAVLLEREQAARREAELQKESLRLLNEELETKVAERTAELQRTTAELQEREAKIRRLVDANIIGIVIWNLEGRIIEANEAFLTMLGYGREDLVSDRVSWREITPDKWRAADEQALTELAATGVCQPFEKEYFRKDGSRVPVLVGAALLEGRRDEGVAFVVDLTERKLAEEALHQIQAELAHINRITAMGQLAASITHEVNQPLAAIVNNADACLNWLAANNLEEARESAALVVAGGHRASEIIGRIRALIKKAPPRKDALGINEAIVEVITLTHSEAVKNGVSVQTQLAEDLPLIQGDRVQLQQVILNLILNAVQAMSDVSEKSRELRISTEQEASGAVLVTVQDSGPGLNPESVDRVFEAFYTTKPQGMGMGLAICRSIVEAHGGKLWATANQGRGATFQFTLPTGGERIRGSASS